MGGGGAREGGSEGEGGGETERQKLGGSKVRKGLQGARERAKQARRQGDKQTGSEGLMEEKRQVRISINVFHRLSQPNFCDLVLIFEHYSLFFLP